MTKPFASSKGCGVGLRTVHYPDIIDKWPAMDWFEAISENYMDTGGRPLHILEKVRGHYPVAFHGTALSIGSTDPLNQNYLKALKRLIDRIQPFLVSDHLCWSGVDQFELHDLLPLPFTEEAVRHISERVKQVQDFLGRKILLENVSTYVTYKHSEMAEWEFISEIAERSGCGILLDVNNIYVNSVNHRFDPFEYVKHIPGALVGQFHLSGHTDMGEFLFDTHSKPIIETVWDLYREAIRLWGPISTLIEWDDHIPPFEHLQSLAKQAREIHDGCHPEAQRAEGSLTLDFLPPTAVRNDKQAISLHEAEKRFKERIKPSFSQDKMSLNEAREMLNPQGKTPGEKRVEIYANGFFVRMEEALGEVYEALRHILGAEEFSALCHAYSKAVPSKDYNLLYAGEGLPDFLRHSPKAGEFPYLADLAVLEWEIWKSFHAFDGPSVDREKMAIIAPEDWEHIRLYFQPSVRIYSSERSIFDLWRFGREKKAGVPEIVLNPQNVLVTRLNDQVKCELISAQESGLIRGLMEGKTLGAIFDGMAETDDEIPVAAWFSKWVQNGLIADYKLETEHARRI